MPRGRGRARTDFSQYSHHQLVQMLHAGKPETASGAAESWAAVGAALHERAGDIERQLREFEQWWDGGAARQYQTMINDLTSGIRQVANTAFSVRDLAHSSAEALGTAQKAMPAPVAVPELAPSVIAAATTPLIVPADTPPSTVDALRQHQAEATAEVRAQQQAQTASNAAHQQAVQVMSTLATEYVTTEDSMPVTPSAASRPTTGTPIEEPPPVTPALPPVPPPGEPVATPVDPAPTDPNDPDGPPPAAPARPLFGTMFTAGLAAAAAALGGRFTNVPPALGAKPKDEKKDVARVPTADDRAAGGGARISAGGAGGGGGVGGGGGADLSPVGNQSLAGQAGGPAASGLAGAAGTAAGVAAAKGMAGGFMPAMPYAPMGGGEAAGGRRIPPWLVETEDVWGEQSVVTPAVIGEDPEADQPGARSWR
ncbi:WXG100 family type VII secretion target [Micromonospora sp. NPDC047074]|uniref:WXG100 family type VII secretion target n=1 Tax=Micromonospora sp. NPDC047074 TaxID=3154339 RepID=UPI0033D13333